ncbi:SAM-dependent methyltransferase [Streptomyces sp. NPDC047117]|uniref:SAM-dependent methyltransferase n=1 Tax=Streptomyces sp. NPDC047117 TaxID=3155379 RepID=UPI0033C2FD4E
MEYREEPVSRIIDASRPSFARMNNWFLGGHEHYEADRQVGRELLDMAPSTRELVRNNRLFLERAVGVLAKEYGVRQFLDHGSGLPLPKNVHQVAQQVDQDARVVYIDNDPHVHAHARSLLDANDETVVIQADITDTDAIFGHPDVAELLDLTRPVAALFTSVLHCLPDEVGPGELVRRVAERLPTGSFVVLSHLVSDESAMREKATAFMRHYFGSGWGRVRARHEVESYVADFDILDPPGHLVEVSRWRPDTEVAPRQRSQEWIEYGGVACIR